MSSIKTIKTRILDIAELCDGIVTVGDQFNAEGKPLAWTAAQLPAVTCYYAETTNRQRVTLGRSLRVTRTFDVVRFQVLLPKPYSFQEARDAIEAAEEVSDVLPGHFLLTPKLDLDGAALVFQCDPMTDKGAELIAYGERWYGAMVYKLPVIDYT